MLIGTTDNAVNRSPLEESFGTTYNADNNSKLEELIATTSNSVNNIAPQEVTGTETEMLVVKSEALAKYRNTMQLLRS